MADTERTVSVVDVWGDSDPSSATAVATPPAPATSPSEPASPPEPPATTVPTADEAVDLTSIPELQAAEAAQAASTAPEPAAPATPPSKETAPAMPDLSAIDADRLRRHPRIAGIVGDLLQRERTELRKQWESDQRTAQETDAQRQARGQREAKKQELWAQSQAGDYDATQELNKLLMDEQTLRATEQALQSRVDASLQQRQQEVQGKVWTDMATAYGVAPDDEDVLAVPADAGVAGLAHALIRRANDPQVVAAMQANPAIQSWFTTELAKAKAGAEQERTAAVKAAREAGLISGQARVMATGQASQPSLTPGGTGRPLPTDDDILRLFNDTEAPSPQLTRAARSILFRRENRVGAQL